MKKVLKIKLAFLVTCLCLIAYLNSRFNIITNNINIITFINRGAVVSVFGYIAYLVLSSFQQLGEKNSKE